MSADLRHVYWLGGGSGAGKSTVARRLAHEHGLRLYDTDEAMADHAARSTPEDSPALQEFMAMDMAERWSDRSPEVMLEGFIVTLLNRLLAQPDVPWHPRLMMRDKMRHP